MRLTPRYDGPPVLRFEGSNGDPSIPLLRQRRRLAGRLADLEDGQWEGRTRCDDWTVREVVAHLVSTDQFWALSATAALAGTPTRYLEGFDPVITPSLLVDGMGESPPADLLASYRQGVEALAACLSGLDEEQWSLPADAPPGHVPLRAMVGHALWDAWVHERDIVLPLGLAPVEEPDEIVASLQYVAALGPAFMVTNSAARPGVLVFEGTDPEARVVVEVGDAVVVGDGEPPAGAVRIEGRSVDLVEALSLRAPFPQPLDDDTRSLLGGLAVVFDQATAAG